jgi:hypothetical protein
LHCACCGAQLPEQTPLTQVCETQGWAVPQLPASEQVCTALEVHSLLPGTQEPVQVPPLQRYGQGGPLFCQVPAALHSCG